MMTATMIMMNDDGDDEDSHCGDDDDDADAEDDNDDDAEVCHNIEYNNHAYRLPGWRLLQITSISGKKSLITLLATGSGSATWPRSSTS